MTTSKPNHDRDDDLLVTQEGAILTLTLHAPKKRNALTKNMRPKLLTELQKANQNNDIRAVIITGSEGMFCSGGDISAMDSTGISNGRQRMQNLTELAKLMIAMNKPVIAAVEGWAAGAGFSLALACDTIVGSQSARFISSFGKIGLAPDLGMLYSLANRVSPAQAKQILFYCDPINAPEAKTLGIIDHLAPEGEALKRAKELANQLLQLAPIPISMMKSLFARGVDEILDYEINMQTQLFLTADHDEGKIAFREKRNPLFKGV